MRAVIYCRVSKDRSGGRSVEEQEAESRRLCAERGWEVAEVITDSVGASRHSRGQRSGWHRTIALVEAGDVDVLVTWEASRAQRDLAAYADLRELCARTGTLWCYSGRVHDLSVSDDRFRTGIDALIAEREADDIVERVQRAVRSNAAKGRPHGRRLFGYQRIYDPASGLLAGQEPHPAEADVVRRIYAEYLAGDGIRVIARRLNDDGITTGTGARWQDGQVRRVLTNPAYVARRVHRGEVIGPADWPALVSDDDFERVAARLADQNARRVRHTPKARLLSGLARCGVCGAKMFVGHDRKHRKVYLCREGFHVARDERMLDAYVTRAVLDYLARTDVAQLVADAPDPAIAQAREHLADLRSRLDDAIGQFTAGELTGATLGRIEADLLARIAETETKLRRSVLPLSIDLPDGDLDDWWDGLTETARQREVVRALLASITVHKLDRPGSKRFDPDGVTLDWRFS